VFRTFTGSTSEATRALAALVAEVGDGRDIPDRSQRGTTVAELLDGYLTYLRDHKGRRHSTLVRYQGLVDRWILPALGDRIADRVLPDDIEAALGSMRAAGQSQSSIHQTFTLLNGTFKWARRNRTIRRNPMIEAEEPRSTAVRREVTPPDVSSLLALLAAAKQDDRELGLLSHIGAVTGMRRGELAGLRWSAIDVANARIRVATTVNDAGGTVVINDTTKTGKPRTVGVDAHTIELLRRHRQEMEHRAEQCGTVLADDAFVASHSPSGITPVRPEYLTRRMRQLRASLGLQAAEFDATLQALRHWAQTTLTEAGYDSRQIAARGGHTEAVMKAVYIHRTAESEHRMTTHLGRLLAGDE
jgi:integrase